MSHSRSKLRLAVAAVGAMMLAPGIAHAQSLMNLDNGSLRSGLQQRYGAALAATQNLAVVNANDPRFIWASQAKVQCAIAIGFMKSSTRDPVSIAKCDEAYQRMQQLPAQPAPLPPAPPPPPPPPPPQACNKGPFIVFFDWDKSDITPEAATILDSAVAARGNCGDVPINLGGYTDRSGSTEYNFGLAARRNASVENYLVSKGVPESAISTHAFGESNPRVPTDDGVRELQNRRVEITAQ